MPFLYKMVRTIFFDTETTGLPKYMYLSALQKANNWPDLVSICWMVFEEAKQVKKEYHIIQPEGWTITAESVKFHGITQERAMAEGSSLKTVMEGFKNDYETADHIVAHNMHFDRNVIFNAFAWRLNMGPTGFWKVNKEICTMIKSKEELKILSKYANDLKVSYKYPALDELYRDTFGEEPPENAHSADRDVDVLQKIFWKRWGAVEGMHV